MRVKSILEWFKSELERNYKPKKSLIVQLEPDLPGDSGNFFTFESEEISVRVMYWNTGAIDMGSVDMIAEELLISFSYVPDNYETKKYPKESEDILVEKINELLILLHNKNSSLNSQLPDNV